MIRSMTGFASVSRERDGVTAAVTLKSVNHRFLDIQVKAPSSLSGLESRIKAAIQHRISRGRVDVSVVCDTTHEPVREVTLNEGLLTQVQAVIDTARDKGLVSGTLSASDLLRIPHAIEIRLAAVPDVPETSAAVVEDVLADAIESLVQMRDTEGQFLAADLDSRVQTLRGLVVEVERKAADGQSALEARLRERLAGLPSDLQADPAALGPEIVRFVARSDIHEEVARMHGHVEHWRALVAGQEPCGRKLDFLVQEMNREINTIGSKAEGLSVTELVVSAKAELERIREQVQNVE